MITTDIYVFSLQKFKQTFPPIKEAKKEKKKITKQLRALRNTALVTFYGINTMFVILVFALQANVDKVSIPWFCGDNLRLEPIGFMFILIFGLILAIQTGGMIKHRLSTFLHVIATVSFSDTQIDERSQFMEGADSLTLVLASEAGDKVDGVEAGTSSSNRQNLHNKPKWVEKAQKRGEEVRARSHEIAPQPGVSNDESIV